jgi:ABC-type microcin C transport system permease subunit YejB
MRHLKARLFAIVLILVFAGLTYLSWHELLTTAATRSRWRPLRRWASSEDCSS